jgi:hypothetical protein
MLVALVLLLVVLIILIFTIQQIIALIRDLIAILSRTGYRQGDLLAESIQNEFPIEEEFVFVGTYVSHWEIGRFIWDKDQSVALGQSDSGIGCELHIPCESGWDWLTVALGYPTTREGLAGKFHIRFRGKILEKGCFGHMGICAYRIEVIEMLTVELLSA